VRLSVCSTLLTKCNSAQRSSTKCTCPRVEGRRICKENTHTQSTKLFWQFLHLKRHITPSTCPKDMWDISLHLPHTEHIRLMAQATLAKRALPRRVRRHRWNKFAIIQRSYLTVHTCTPYNMIAKWAFIYTNYAPNCSFCFVIYVGVSTTALAIIVHQNFTITEVKHYWGKTGPWL